MDVSESQLSIVLQEAFTCYLTFLYDTRKLQESRLPRAGNGVESPADVSNSDYFQSRISSTETCLQFLSEIARKVRKLIDEASKSRRYRGRSTAPKPARFDIRENKLEDPFWDTPSRHRLRAAESFSAEQKQSSRRWDEAMANTRRASQSQPERPSATKSHTRSRSRAPRSSTGHSSTSTPSSAAAGAHAKIPLSTTSTAAESPFISLYPFAKRRYSNTPSAPNHSTHDEGSSSSSRTSRSISRPAIPRSTRNAEDERLARRVHTEERRRREELERSLAQTKRLAEEWEREEKARVEASEKYARNLQREEKARLARIERDREAAKKAAEGQEQWELAAIAREAEAMRAEERRRRDNNERVKHREPSKARSTSRRPDSGVPERTTVLSEEKKRREATNVAEAERKRKEAVKRKPVVKKVDCVSCMEPGEVKDMVTLACRHAYCAECIKTAFKSSFKSKSPFKCCGGKSIDPSTLPTINTLLPTSFLTKYSLLLLELSTPNPRFCSSPSCSLFLPPSTIHGSIGTCSTCQTRTCVLCKGKEHGGICKEDRDGKKLEEMGKKQGWRMCGSCNAMVERTEGCLHITCRCGSEWCYACGRDWKVCGSACGRSAGPQPFFQFRPQEGNQAAENQFEHREADEEETGGFGAGRAIALGLAAAAGVAIYRQHNQRRVGRGEEAGGIAGAGLAVVPVLATAALLALFRD